MKLLPRARTRLCFTPPRALRTSGLCLLLIMAMAGPALAQTTGTLSGTITDQSGGLLPGVAVVAVHVPTGTTYEAVTDTDGNFAIANVRVGGPYSVTAALAGFKEETQQGLQVQLGAEVEVPFQLELATLTETVNVTAQANPIINPARTGAASNMYRETIETLPTLSQNINDFARVNPYFQTDAGRGGLAVAGRNYRYNAIQIDGAVTNDLFGLSSTGAPGGQAGTNPISLDAVGEIQLVVAPYDVRLGGFTGGGINAVTRSGTNEFHGSGYYYFRNNDLVGEGPLERPLAAFSNKLYGASFGGPIARDRAFFFATGEQTRRNQPSGFSVSGASGQNFGHQAEIQRVADILRSRYGFDPGGFDEFEYERNGNKVFARTDFNLGRHQLTGRHSWVKGRDEQFGSLSALVFSLPNTSYGITNNTNSTVGQLNSTFGNQRYNELRLVYTRIRDYRDVPQRFPTVQVFFPDNTSVFAGTERSSHANSLDQDSFEITNDFTWYAGRHAVTIGTHNEFFKFANLFTGQLFGEYTFNSIDLFEQGLAQAYLRNFSRTGDPLEQARFGVSQWGFYVGDQWKARPNLTLTFGGRVDLPRFGDEPLANPRTVELFGYATDVMPSPTQFSPRLGFNWDLSGDSSQQVRGGIGVFTGRTPYVWLSNSFISTGVQFARLSVARNAANRIPFNADPDNQPTQIGAAAGAASNEYALVDPDFKFPSLLRYNIAYDRDLGWGLYGTAEFLYADTLQEILYENVNLQPTGATAFDGRPIFTRVDPATGAAYLLTNTTEGMSWTVNFKVERPFRNGMYASASYLYNDATSVNDGTSSTAASQFGNNPVPGDPNDPPVTLSNYATGHRVNLAVSYNRMLFAGVDTTLSVFFNGQSGLPFKYIFASGNDLNGDTSIGTGSAVNDLLYVPRDPSEVIVTGGTWEQLDAFIEADPGLRKYRGQIVERNSTRLDWRNYMDFRWAFGIPVRSRAKVEVVADVQNFLNLFDNNAGRVEEEFFPGLAPIRYNGLQDGKPVYQLLFTSPTFAKGSYQDLPSRWQAQLGARVRF